MVSPPCPAACAAARPSSPPAWSPPASRCPASPTPPTPRRAAAAHRRRAARRRADRRGRRAVRHRRRDQPPRPARAARAAAAAAAPTLTVAASRASHDACGSGTAGDGQARGSRCSARCGEYDVVRDGTRRVDLRQRSERRHATSSLPEGAPETAPRPGAPAPPDARRTPPRRLLAAVEPTHDRHASDGTAEVAGRAAYELVLEPADDRHAGRRGAHRRRRARRTSRCGCRSSPRARPSRPSRSASPRSASTVPDARALRASPRRPARR